MVSLFFILIIIILIFTIIFINFYNSYYSNIIKNHEIVNINNIYYIDSFDRYNSIIMEKIDNLSIDIIKNKYFNNNMNLTILNQAYNSKCSIFYMDSEIIKYTNVNKNINIILKNYGIISDIYNYINENILNGKFEININIYQKYGNVKNNILNNFIIMPDFLIYDNNYLYICYYTLITMANIMFDNSYILYNNIDINLYNEIMLTSRIIKNMAINMDINYFKYIVNNSNYLFSDNTTSLIKRKDFMSYKQKNIVIIKNNILLYDKISIIFDYENTENYFGNYLIINKHYIDYISVYSSGFFYILNKNKYDIKYKQFSKIYKKKYYIV